MELFIKFPDQSESFTCGVEYGRIYDRMEKGDAVVNNNGFPIKISNKELIIDTCKKFGYTYSFGIEYYGEWVEFSAIKITTSKN